MSSRSAAVASVAAALAVALSAPGFFRTAPAPADFPARLDVNRASARELDLLPSVGPRSAERIVADREAHGPFRTAAEVRRVRGVARRAAERIARLAVAR